MTTIDRPSRRKGSAKRPASRVRRAPPTTAPEGVADASSASEPAPPPERRVYPREPRVWEEWESPLRERLLARRIVRWVRLRVSRAPDSERS